MQLMGQCQAEGLYEPTRAEPVWTLSGLMIGLAQVSRHMEMKAFPTFPSNLTKNILLQEFFNVSELYFMVMLLK